jgi:hypothetical protein
MTEDKIDEIKQWFSTFVRLRPGKFFFLQDERPVKLRAVARRLRNTDIKHRFYEQL